MKPDFESGSGLTPSVLRIWQPGSIILRTRTYMTEKKLAGNCITVIG